MSTTDPNRTGRSGDRAGGGTPRPATPVVAVVVAAVAGLLGLLILKDVKDDPGGGGGSPSKPTTTKAGTPTSSGPTATTGELVVRQGATVLVAIASGEDGVAGALTTALKNRGYTTAAALTATVKRDTTLILVKDGDEQAAKVAKAILSDMGLAGPTSSLPAAAPVKGDIGTATVIIILGKDKAGEALKPIGSSTAPSTPTATSSATATSKPTATT